MGNLLRGSEIMDEDLIFQMKLETQLSTISIFIFVFPLVVSLFIFFEKKRAYKFNELLLYLENCISSESKQK